MAYLIDPKPVAVENYDDHERFSEDPALEKPFLDNRCGRELVIPSVPTHIRDNAVRVRGEECRKMLQSAFFNAARLAKKNDREAVLAYVRGLRSSPDPVQFYFHFVLECIFRADELILKAIDIGKFAINNISHHSKLIRKMELQPTQMTEFRRFAFSFLFVNTECGEYISIPYEYGEGICQILAEYFKDELVQDIKNSSALKIRCYWQQGLKEKCKYCYSEKQKKKLSYLNHTGMNRFKGNSKGKDSSASGNPSSSRA